MLCFVCSPSRLYGKPWPLDINNRFGMLFKIGTLPETEDRPFSWVLSAPLEFLTDAGIDFDPEVRSIKSVQGKSEGKTSALEVSQADDQMSHSGVLSAPGIDCSSQMTQRPGVANVFKTDLRVRLLQQTQTWTKEGPEQH